MSTTSNLQSPDATAQISGFYGPGMFAAWVITLITCWIRIFQNNYDHNFHFMVYAFYTNWAAIDVIRHISAAGYDKLFGGVSQDDDSLAKVVAACQAVVFTGLIHALFLACACLCKLGREDAPHTRKKLSARIWIIHVGMVVPLFALCYAVNAARDDHVVYIVYFSSIGGYVPVGLGAMAVTITESSYHLRFAFLMYFLFVSSYLFYISQMHVETLRISRGETTFYVYPSQVMEALHDRCAHIPCAPQRIDEWDQAFTLFCALYFFLYEFFGSMVRLPKRIWNALSNIGPLVARLRGRAPTSQAQQHFPLV